MSNIASLKKTLFDIDIHFCSENKRIKVVKFIKAATNLKNVMEHFGKAFAPIRYDIEGNINKIKHQYKYDENSCLLDLMLDEIKKGPPIAAEGVLWLNRTLLMFELLFREMLHHLKTKDYDVNMKKLFTVAYDGSVRRYHNWITQQIFHFLCKMFSTFGDFLKQLEIDDIEDFEKKLTTYNESLHCVRCEIDNFFILHNFGIKTQYL